MNVVVLGGCADMAVPLLALLKGDPDVRRVTLADINYEKASRIATRMGRKFNSVQCDAEQPGTVIAAVTGNDVAMGYIGPFYLYEKRMAGCAIETGVPYVSIADDYDAYLDVITLEEKAREKNIKILTGFGNSPGLTQVLARKGYNDLPNARRINVNWCAGSNESVGPSNLIHLFHIFNGTTLQTISGKEVCVKSGRGKKTVSFPEPIGRSHVYYTGHAESVSLPRNLSGLTEVTLHGGIKPNYIVILVKLLSLMGLSKTHFRRSVLAKLVHRIENLFAFQGIDKSVGRVDIHGEASGRPCFKYFTYVGHIAEITSIPAYVAAKWLVEGRFHSYPGGVYSPERLLEYPNAFIEALKEHRIDIYESDTKFVGNAAEI